LYPCKTFHLSVLGTQMHKCLHQQNDNNQHLNPEVPKPEREVIMELTASGQVHGTTSTDV